MGRHGRLILVLFGLLALVALFEGYLLYQQSVAHRVTKAQQDKLLNTFLKGDTAQVAGGGSIHIRLQNVRFKWSEQVFIDAGNMAIKAVPVKGGVCNFDDLESFHLTLQQSAVRVRPSVLAGMFNEAVFNYPGSKVRDFDVTIDHGDDDDGKEKLVVLSGKASMVAWIPFKMYVKLGVDKKNNAMIIRVDHLKVFGHVPATKILHLGPFHLDKLISIPPNQSLLVNGNDILVKPFGLFPPPRITGQLEDVKIHDSDVEIDFSGEAASAPRSSVKNYVYMSGGVAQFGKFRMYDTDVLIVDRDQSDWFAFSVAHYADMIRKSAIDVRDLRAITVSMPDY